MDETRDGQAVFRFLVFDSMAAGDDDTAFIGLLVAPFEDSPDGFAAHGQIDAHDVHGQFGFGSHGIDVAQGVGRRNLTE